MWVNPHPYKLPKIWLAIPMFEPTDKPRVYGQSPGTDFPHALIKGVLDRFETSNPMDLAQVEVFVNTRRMQRRIREAFDAGRPRLLPKIRLITDLGNDPEAADLPLPVSPLRRRFEISQLVAGLLEKEPDLAARSALFDLSDSLASLMDEMHGEGVPPSVIEALDVDDQSGHWERALKFISIANQFFGDSAERPDVEARQRMIIDRMVAQWEHNPPTHPIIIAGSTGSRGATAKLMKAVACLPLGAVVFPGFDFHQPQSIWDHLTADTDRNIPLEDHPQYRFANLLKTLNLKRTDVKEWASIPEPNKARNALVSLALRPAPITDHWLTDGPKLTNLNGATQNVTLLEAASPREESIAIALRLREGVDKNETVALISPDRLLTRQVAAALDKWGIVPDDSAGVPLQLTASGRFLRHVCSLIGQDINAETLLVLFKHPLFCSGSNIRGQHLLWSRELEIEVRKNGPAHPTADDLISWASDFDDTERLEWARWIGAHFFELQSTGIKSLSDHVAQHIQLAEILAAGPNSENPDALWSGNEGREVRRTIVELQENAQFGGELTVRDYVDVFGSVLSKGEMRSSVEPHPNVLIWGTLEARVQGADTVILAGLNEGTWPENPNPDPWLNRALRQQAGLLIPDRRIGLAAHDFQQALGVEKLWITRSIRSEDAETVPSRWLNRLTNLLGGLPKQHGDTALQSMRKRGQVWIQKARAFDQPDFTTKPAHRPSPKPPVNARPKKLSVTQIKTLIRDPYAIYAREVLRLKKLDPLVMAADARTRGIAMHAVMEEFIAQHDITDEASAKSVLLDIGERVFDEHMSWPMMQRLWVARLAELSDKFIADEIERQAVASPSFYEKRGSIPVADTDVTLTGVLDRIDLSPDGTARVYDYKTGAIPTIKQQNAFDKQLLLQAAMVENNGFDDVPATPVDWAAFLGLGRDPKTVASDLSDGQIKQAWEEFVELIKAYGHYDRGYSSRLAMFKDSDPSDYAHLSRFGEWDISHDVEPEDLT